MILGLLEIVLLQWLHDMSIVIAINAWTKIRSKSHLKGKTQKKSEIWKTERLLCILKLWNWKSWSWRARDRLKPRWQKTGFVLFALIFLFVRTRWLSIPQILGKEVIWYLDFILFLEKSSYSVLFTRVTKGMVQQSYVSHYTFILVEKGGQTNNHFILILLIVCISAWKRERMKIINDAQVSTKSTSFLSFASPYPPLNRLVPLMIDNLVLP